MKKTAILIVAIFSCVILVPANSLAQTEKVILAGYQLEPPVKTSGSGLAVVQLKNDSLQISGDFSYLTNRYYGAYVMFGEAGESGNQLFRLEVDLNEEGTGGVLHAEENTFELSQTQISLLKQGKLYIVIATYDHPTGEIGGRINF